MQSSGGTRQRGSSRRDWATAISGFAKFRDWRRQNSKGLGEQEDLDWLGQILRLTTGLTTLGLVSAEARGERGEMLDGTYLRIDTAV